METQHRIVIHDNSLIIDEMYFRLNEIRFVDVTKQESSLLRNLCGISAGFSFLLAAALTGMEFTGAAGFFFLWALGCACCFGMIKRQYALRIGLNFGSTKAIISPDKEELEHIRRKILVVLETSATR